jgi:hypothetical protein
LAEIIGMTQSQVDFFMLKSEKLGFFHHSGGLHVNDSPHNVPLRDQQGLRGTASMENGHDRQCFPAIILPRNGLIWKMKWGRIRGKQSGPCAM